MGAHRLDGPTHFRGQATCLLDASGHFLNVSPSMAEFLHCDGRILRGQNLLGCMEPAEARWVADRLAEVAAGKGAAAFQIRLAPPGGAPTWVSMELSRPTGNGFLVAAISGPGAG